MTVESREVLSLSSASKIFEMNILPGNHSQSVEVVVPAARDEISRQARFRRSPGAGGHHFQE